MLLFSSFTLFLNFEYGFFDITVLVDDEDLGECNGSTTAGLGKREDRQTAIERGHCYLNVRHLQCLGTGEDAIAELCTSIDNSVLDFYCYTDTSPSTPVFK